MEDRKIGQINFRGYFPAACRPLQRRARKQEVAASKIILQRLQIFSAISA
jgi:hypothetical protein